MENIIPSSQESTEVIQPINRDTVHRICSGQVVLSLAIAVKELVENAIDAAATIIDIRLKEYGADLIEVSDNGKGVVQENFQALTLKHYTSKIKQFNDLETLCTLGFRGEALSSLCALSDLTILTKHSTADHAAKITYDRNGKITSEILGAREQGTTVTLENLFSTLPVRRKEFMKNLKREFNKMCQLLYAYCLVSKGIKFSCTNTTNKGSKNCVVSTEGLSTVKENIINVFGSKQISTLIEVEVVRPEEPILGEFGVKLVEGETLPFSFEFFVSSVMHGCGRSTNDRQFFYINSRPCDPTKIIKLVNEIYKQYNCSQYPFVYLNILSNSCLVDVNVTPDKRQIFLEKEKVLLATLKTSLIEGFKIFPSTYKMQNLELSQNTTIKDFFENDQGQSRGLKRSISDSTTQKLSITEKFKKRSKTENDKYSRKSSLLSFVSKSNSENSDFDTTSRDVKLDTFVEIANEISNDLVDTEEKKIICDRIQSIKSDNIVDVVDVKDKETHNITEIKTKENNDELSKSNNKRVDSTKNEDIKKTGNDTIKLCKDFIEDESIVETTNDEEKEELKDSQISFLEDDTEVSIDLSVKSKPPRKSIIINVSIGEIKKSLKRKNKPKETSDIKVRFRSQITPECNKKAEEELQKQISKEDFAQMSIIGQFNLGFIIVKLHNDLFIVDQHASDEKYNFEELQANTVMENQILVNPKPLELTAGNESLLIDNKEIFRKNGFNFKIDEMAPCTKKVSLTAIPLSKNIVFGKDDIDEMLFMLQDSNHVMCRPSRIRAMFASRACHKSVMIGKPLSKSDMKRLIEHMGKIEQPWNCPHGRPTMRHLINLDLIHDK